MPKKKTGRTGMDLWHILVLAVVRHAANIDWDMLEGLSNFHELIRQVMGVHNPRFSESERITFKYQSIIDNVSLIDERGSAVLFLSINFYCLRLILTFSPSGFCDAYRLNGRSRSGSLLPYYDLC